MPSSAGLPELRWSQGLRYGLMALPLAFVALPLYVFLPITTPAALAYRWLAWVFCCFWRGWPMP